MPMLPGWSAAAQAQLENGSISPAIFLRVETDPIMRIWTGIGAFPLPADGVIETEDGAIYSGFGNIIDMPELEMFLNGDAGRIGLTLAGPVVTKQVLAAVNDDLDVTEGVECNFGLLILGQDLQPISPVAWLWAGQGSSLTVEVDRSTGGVSSITFPIGSLMTGRSRPAEERWTDASQKARTGGTDRALEHMADMSEGATKQWPTP